MPITYKSQHFLQEDRLIWCKLMLCTVIGASCGILFAAFVGEPYITLMLSAARQPLSIVGSTTAFFLPFLVAVFLILYSKPWLLYSICAAYICSYTAIGWSCCHHFGTGGWIVAFLLQFPNHMIIPSLLYLTVRRLSCKSCRRIGICLTPIAAVLGILDYWLISPFLADLIESYNALGR